MILYCNRQAKTENKNRKGKKGIGFMTDYFVFKLRTLIQVHLA